jgi:hypothetical protein
VDAPTTAAVHPAPNEVPRVRTHREGATPPPDATTAGVTAPAVAGRRVRVTRAVPTDLLGIARDTVAGPVRTTVAGARVRGRAATAAVTVEVVPVVMAAQAGRPVLGATSTTARAASTAPVTTRGEPGTSVAGRTTGAAVRRGGIGGTPRLVESAGIQGPGTTGGTARPAATDVTARPAATGGTARLAGTAVRVRLGTATGVRPAIVGTPRAGRTAGTTAPVVTVPVTTARCGPRTVRSVGTRTRSRGRPNRRCRTR